MTTIVNLIQQSPQWHAHRAAHWNASDAPAMLGASSNTKRTELLRAISTGVEREFSDYVQDKIIGPGHTFEALAREVAESILCEDLYPCVVVDGKLSASLDGLTVGGDTAWEHKRLNKALRDAMRADCNGSDLPEMYRIQCEHQLIVSKADRVLFMASEWDDEGNLIEERHCWYYPDAELRARIVTGWAQFAMDLQAYQPREHSPAPTGRAPGQLPTLRIEVTGMVTASNLAEWEAAATELFSGINRDLSTDQDFADAELAVKGCSDIESQLEAAKERILSGTESIEATFKTIDRMKEQARATRLALSKLVDARKLARRTEIVERGKQAVLAHYSTINASLGAHAIAQPASLITELGAAIKGKKSFASMEDAVDSAVANLKIAASQQADRVRASMAALADAQGEFATLFPDRVQLCASKAPDDLRNLAAARISEHKAKEQKRLDEERERIRQEEVAKLERERQEQESARAAEAEAEAEAEAVRLRQAEAYGRAESVASDAVAMLAAEPAPPLCLARDGEPPSFLAGHPAAFRVPRDKLDSNCRDATIEERLAAAAAAPPEIGGLDTAIADAALTKLATLGVSAESFLERAWDTAGSPGRFTVKQVASALGVDPGTLIDPCAPMTTIKLGDINARIAPLTISAEGMSKLGFDPVNSQGAAKLYNERDFSRICSAMWALLVKAAATGAT